MKINNFQEKVYPVRKSRKKPIKREKLKFSNGVYGVVSKIPKGKVMSYKEVARKAGRPRAYRAVGNIMNRNPDPKKVPCHRVIRSDGKIGGYAKGTKAKIAILKKEGVKIINDKVMGYAD